MRKIKANSGSNYSGGLPATHAPRYAPGFAASFRRQCSEQKKVGFASVGIRASRIRFCHRHPAHRIGVRRGGAGRMVDVPMAGLAVFVRHHCLQRQCRG